MIDQHSRLGDHAPAVKTAMDALQAANAVERLWTKDTTLWTEDPAHAKIISNSLGWLTVPDYVRPMAADLAAFGDEIAGAGFTHIVLMGMGGSSLCTEVLRRVNIPMAGHPELIVPR